MATPVLVPALRFKRIDAFALNKTSGENLR
jgi:hypothetical protein